MKRDPAEIVHLLAEELRQMGPGEEASINALATRTKLHWITVDRYLSLLCFVHRHAPQMEIVQAGRSKAVRITLNPMLSSLEPSERLILRLYRSGAVSPETAVEALKEEAKVAAALADTGRVRFEGQDRVRLTREGLLMAAQVHGQVSKAFDEGIQPSLEADEAESVTISTRDVLQELSARQTKMEALIRELLARRGIEAEEVVDRSPKAPRPSNFRDPGDSNVSIAPARRKRDFGLESPLPNSA